MPDKTEKKQGKFRKGHSGNPLGRPRGTRNKATIAAEALFEREMDAVSYKRLKTHTTEQIDRLTIQINELEVADTAFEKYARHGMSLLKD